MGRKLVFRKDVSCPSCGSHHVVKCGRPLGRQKYLCRGCGKYFLVDASYHHPRLNFSQNVRVPSNLSLY